MGHKISISQTSCRSDFSSFCRGSGFLDGVMGVKISVLLYLEIVNTNVELPLRF